MGEHNIQQERDNEAVRVFTKALLADVAALEEMLSTDRIESGIRRIGAEQEMFLVDSGLRPASISMDLLRQVSDPRLTTEIALFNLEANLSPHSFEGDCLRLLEKELDEVISIVRKAASSLGADVVLAGILPTLRLSDLELKNLTPSARYFELNRVVSQLRGNDFTFHIKGLDEIQLSHKNVMVESCNTSFQAHLQVGPEEFASVYNAVQVATAPVLAAAVNSPLLLGNRLWHETRLALFQQSVDERSSTRQGRGTPTRVSFGESWVDDSVLEIFREEIARFRVIMTTKSHEDPLEELAQGRIPQLAALRLHNSTVWRWNRPCYGVAGGRAHLRIENRVLPAGPSIQDEVANAAFLFGLTLGLEQKYGDIRNHIEFDDAKANLISAARYGLKAQLTWLDGKCYIAGPLIKQQLLPLAKSGLAQANINSEDIDRYLGIIEDRVTTGQTGAQWMLQSLSSMGDHYTNEVRSRELVAAMLECQSKGEPVHKWPIVSEPHPRYWSQNYETVGQFMKTDLFTVRPDDLVNLVAGVMNWKHIRHIPVEDDEGHLVGLVTHRDLLRLLERSLNGKLDQPVSVRQIMKTDPATADPDMPALEAIDIMRRHKIGCLPIVAEGRLVGIVTSYDFLEASATLFQHQLNSNVFKKGAL